MRFIAVFFITIALAACNGVVSNQVHEDETVDPNRSDLSADVPDYAPMGAKVTGKTIEDDWTTVTMETINGPRSPLQFYRVKLPENDWMIIADESDDNGGVIRARQSLRNLTVKIVGRPNGAGADIELRVEE